MVTLCNRRRLTENYGQRTHDRNHLQSRYYVRFTS